MGDRYSRHKSPRMGGKMKGTPFGIAGDRRGSAMGLDVPPLVKPHPMRMSHQEPERHQQFDQRFVMDQVGAGAIDFRQELDDDERRRFLPKLMSARGVDIPLVAHLYGLEYNPELQEEGTMVPESPGIWEMGVDGMYYPVDMASERLIERIAYERGDRQAPMVITG